MTKIEPVKGFRPLQVSSFDLKQAYSKAQLEAHSGRERNISDQILIHEVLNCNVPLKHHLVPLKYASHVNFEK